MRRREFIALVGSAAAFPAASQAQQAAPAQKGLPIIGFLNSGSISVASGTFMSGLNEQGFVEGRNVRFEYRSAHNDQNRLLSLASELVSLPVDVIFAGPSPAAIAAKGATSKVPIVFLVGADPVEAALVASLNAPGGNATGVWTVQESLIPKLFEMLHELLPKSAALALLFNSNHPFSKSAVQKAQAATEVLGRDFVSAGAGTDVEIGPAFENLAQRSGGVVIQQEIFLINHSRQIAQLGLRYKLPIAFPFRPLGEESGLVNYSASFPELLRQCGIYVGKILNGTSPASLPVLQPTKYELVINLKTAKALGIDVPGTLLARANDVIE